MAFPTIALISDYGNKDGIPGNLKGVLFQQVLSRDAMGCAMPCPHVIDITHEIAPQDVMQAAWVLNSSYRNFPENTVFLCIVDPKVGDKHHQHLLMYWKSKGQFFVAPDNGLLTPIIKEAGNDAIVVKVDNTDQFKAINGATDDHFYGRDIFAAVGAYVANAITGSKTIAEVMKEAGEKIESPAETLRLLDWPKAVKTATEIDGHILYVDSFGNLMTNIPNDWVEATAHVEIQLLNKKWQSQRLISYVDDSGKDKVFLVPTATGCLSLTVYKDSAHRVTESSVGDSVIIHY